MQFVFNQLRRLCCLREISTSTLPKLEDGHREASQQPYEPVPEDYPIFPPPPPQEILLDPEQYWATVSRRKYAAPRGVFKDSSLYALYRLYEYIEESLKTPRGAAYFRLHTVAQYCSGSSRI